MTLERIIQTHGVEWSADVEERIQRHLDHLERRLVHHPEPVANLVFTEHPSTRKIGLHLRVQLGPLGPTLFSRRSAETPDHVVRLAVEDIERQLDREHAEQRGEPTYGVPSRRLPEALRPLFLTRGIAEEEGAEEEEPGAVGAEAETPAPRPASAIEPESGRPGGGRGRRDEVGGSGVYPMSGPLPAGDAVIRGQMEWGQGERGAAGYENHGESEVFHIPPDFELEEEPPPPPPSE